MGKVLYCARAVQQCGHRCDGNRAMERKRVQPCPLESLSVSHRKHWQLVGWAPGAGGLADATCGTPPRMFETMINENWPTTCTHCPRTWRAGPAFYMQARPPQSVKQRVIARP